MSALNLWGGLRFKRRARRPEGRFKVGGLKFNSSLTDFTLLTNQREVVLLKNDTMLDFYRDFFSGKPIGKILEYGTWEGGSPLYFAAASNVEKIVGIDIRDPADAILEHASKFAGRLKLVYNTSQADREAVNRVIDEELGGEIDLVIDDASHQYELTKAAFEIAFAKLRVGGYYVIEDWNWAHYDDRRYDEVWADQPALSNLVLEIALAIGSIGPIKSMITYNWGVIIEKGAEVPKDFRLEDLIRMGDKRKYHRY